jgi:3-hydroxyisobutyrate dehydrogenase-like beta-hydroxyacid dehydrogenase
MSGERVGFVGLGSMGSAMAPRLAAAGHEVVGYDRFEAAGEALRQAGGRTAGSVAELARDCGIVFMSLPTPLVMREVAIGEAGLIAGAARIVVDLSTSGPRTAAEVAARLGERGIAFVDAPVSGGRAGALAGKLSLMAACSAEVWAEIEPLLSIFGKVFHVGEQPGHGQMMKLINNILSVAALAVSSEGMALGVKAGLDPRVMLDVLNASSGRNSATVDKLPRAVLPRSFDFGFATQLSLKDIRLCLEEAEALGVPMMVGSAARTLLAITQASFGPDSDFTCMARVVEQWAGVEIAG